MQLFDITEVFPGATAVNGNLTIPNGAIISCTPGLGSTGYELVFGILETMYRSAVSAGNPNVGVNLTNYAQTVNGVDVLRRTYTFSINLDLSPDVIATLNVNQHQPQP